MEQTTLEVRGMSCDGCEETVTGALEALEGVSAATASREDDEVRVEHDEARVDEATIANVIADAGYEPAV
ncbi:heavy-metal-associated domain-containing protein [Halopiger xanaduensis]|uniref:Heavy metal transport/detoxification protein n=1 Tax=Halopiger xanaduensis (strain DSM 18323 / JCM 14033 / SH-6) TaxID=797210 RepID=F8D965_HALXS|nr:cation transporter [Halopiger xanaduensis]AEH35673.1 Heavy metal transport/detoxification protein [Halopiger xanaduensis SH-6]